MRTIYPYATLAVALLSLAGCSGAGTTSTTASGTTTTVTPATTTVANLTPYADPTGTVATYTTAGVIDESNPFFQPLGTNGRTCATCHQLNQGMSVSTPQINALYLSTLGADPLFAAVDGANCPTASASDSSAHSLILNNGLFRITVTLPATAQFKLTVLSDPYGCAVTTNSSGQQVVSVYRRPLAATTTADFSSLMWDTRETTATLGTLSTFGVNLDTDLTQQATDAILAHAQGAAPTAAQLAQIITFEQGLYTAQITDTLAGSLSANGATGGPANLAATLYYPGINDAQGNDPTGAAFNAGSMQLYKAWNNSSNAQQASIARGEALFNTGILTISDVSGLNNNGAGIPHASCSFCHDTPSIGSRSIGAPLDTGLAHNLAAETDPNIVAGVSAVSVPSLPVYQITGCKDPTTHAAVTYTTSDPGAGLFTGLCSDIGRVKVPSLRGLAARAPYFHNGSATNLAAVVKFYNARFAMGLTAQQQTDLVNLLSAL